MEEDYLHELGHHATGHDSTFCFKEGMAVYTVEVILESEGRVVRAWPFFGRSTSDWVAYCDAHGLRLPLERALSWPGFSNATPARDFLSWQVYIIAGSVCRWYAAQYGARELARCLARRRFLRATGELESEWLRTVGAEGDSAFDPIYQFPGSPRYARFIEFPASRLRLNPHGA